MTSHGTPAPGSEAIPWFRAAFGPLYPLLYAHRDDTAAESESQFAADALGLRRGDRVLDLACGDGRHLVAFARQGCVAIGVDLSVVLAARARNRPGLVVVRADLRALPFADGALDHATCFFTSFGYFDADAENARVLHEAARVLRPGGRFLLDVPDRAELERSLVPEDTVEREGLHVTLRRAIAGGRVRKEVEARSTTGETVARFVESVRIYTLDELRAMLRDAHLHVVREAGAFDGRSIGTGDRFVLVAERAR